MVSILVAAIIAVTALCILVSVLVESIFWAGSYSDRLDRQGHHFLSRIIFILPAWFWLTLIAAWLMYMYKADIQAQRDHSAFKEEVQDGNL